MLNIFLRAHDFDPAIFLFQWDIVKTKAQLIVTSKLVMLNSGNWESLANLKNVYTKDIFYEPWVS